jgi:hypothetical protein
MSQGLIGRGIVAAGIVIGLLAVSLTFASANGETSRYLQDGTVTAFLLIALTITGLQPPEVGLDRLGGAVGAAAFGFYLYGPAVFGFDSFGRLGAGAWLGVSTAIIPIGALITLRADHAAEGGARDAAAAPDRGLLLAAVGLLCALVGIWLPVGSADGSPSYWNASSSGHALGLLMLLVVVLTAACVGSWRLSGRQPAADPALLLAAITFGLVEAVWIGNAFNNFGHLGSGAWLEAAGGLLLVVGVASMRRSAVRTGSTEARMAQPAPSA